MKRYIVNENQRGLLYKNGRLAGILKPGSYRFFGVCEVELFDCEDRVISEKITTEALLTNPLTKDSVISVTVPENHIVLQLIGGVYKSCLNTGKFVFFKGIGHKFISVSTADPMIPTEILNIIKPYAPMLINEVNVAEYERGRLLYDNKFVKLLEPGRYFFWRNCAKKVECSCIDTRANQITIHGQELLTADKVTLRVSVVCTIRVTDCEHFGTLSDPQSQLHVAAQLALRDYVGAKKLDEILENKAAMSDYICEKLTSKACELYLEVRDAGVRDIILPGEIREIMNTVLLAEKQAQANVITRREEVASTRSLLNTAKLMDENQTLYKLKQLEYLSKICENTENLTISDISTLLK